MTQIKKSWVFIKWSKNCFISGAEKGRIDACPQCGNKDKEQTYYLTPHYKQQKGRNYK